MFAVSPSSLITLDRGLMMTHKKHPIAIVLIFLVAVLMALPLATNAQHNEALFESIRSSDYMVLNTLIRNGEDINQTDKIKNTPLMLAAKIGDHRIVDALLSKEADPNLRNNAGATALMLAAKYGHAHVVEQLLLFGADPLIKNNNGITASRFASVYKHKEVFRMLLDAESEALKGITAKPETNATS